jgi:hypothetical protein
MAMSPEQAMPSDEHVVAMSAPHGEMMMLAGHLYMQTNELRDGARPGWKAVLN